MANVNGIEVSGTTYNIEDETARNTATQASQTATTANQTATTASQTATQAEQTATTASQTASENLTRIINIEQVIPSKASNTNKLVTVSDITPSGTQPTTYKNYTNISSAALFDNSGILTKTPTELINALKDKGYIDETQSYQQLHCVINLVNSNADNVTISDGTHSINLVNGWIEFEGAFISGTSTFGSEERWVMKLYNVDDNGMAVVTKRAGVNPIMKTVTLS